MHSSALYNKQMKKNILIIIVLAVGFQMPGIAQEVQYEKANWYFGAAAGSNFNFYRGSTQTLNANLTSPTVFEDGNGAGLYAAALAEYHFTNSVWGIMLQSGYDNRSGEWDQQLSPCNCPLDLSTDLSYITIEPSVRLAPFKNAFYIYAGPRLAFNLNESFTYEKGTNPNFPNQVADPAVEGEFDNIENTIISMQVGAGFDIPLTSNNQKNQFVLSPFVSFQPYFGQNPRSTETWNITTLRAGAALKFGKGRKSMIPEEEVKAALPTVAFTIDSPRNVPGDRIISESFPLSNYVYFEKGSTSIPSRYILLEKDEVNDFKEDQVDLNMSSTLSGRAKREMVVYYNVLNILGDRMVKNPGATITLVGSSDEGVENGKMMASSIKTYLVDVFAINESRIAIEGRNKPKIPSEKPNSTLELDLRSEEDRRVTIESTSPALLMEFQSGPNAPLKPVQIKGIIEAPETSYVTFKADGADEAFSTWMLELTDEQGYVKNYGPYTEEEVQIPGKTILGNNTEGDFKVRMIGTTKDGVVITEESNTNVVLWSPSVMEEGMRFSIIYDFDDSKAISMYEKYLADIVAPKIPQNGTVIINGHTDIIGDTEGNQALSMARANNVKEILASALSKLNNNNVKFEVNGFGEWTDKSPFGNDLPEERSYNRTVIIDVLPNN